MFGYILPFIRPSINKGVICDASKFARTTSWVVMIVPNTPVMIYNFQWRRLAEGTGQNACIGKWEKRERGERERGGVASSVFDPLSCIRQLRPHYKWQSYLDDTITAFFFAANKIKDNSTVTSACEVYMK